MPISITDPITLATDAMRSIRDLRDVEVSITSVSGDRMVAVETRSGAKYYFWTVYSYNRDRTGVVVYSRRHDGTLRRSFWAEAIRVTSDGGLSIRGYGKSIRTTPVTFFTDEAGWTPGVAHCDRELRYIDEDGRDGGGSVQCLANLRPDGSCPRTADHNEMRFL